MTNFAHEFRGTVRFQVLSRLGQGGMGTVYAVFDKEHGLRVAVKSLSASLPVMDADRLLMFKKEFRTIQDLQHPNLVQLGELFDEDGHWFFTMELVEGVDFMSFVSTASSDPAELQTRDNAGALLSRGFEKEKDTELGVETATRAELPAEPGIELQKDAKTKSDTHVLSLTTARHIPSFDEARPGTTAVRITPGFDEARLRSTLTQLVRGLCALHAAGKVHRDIKPSNILVTPVGRLVVLDFGIVSDLKQQEEWGEQRTIGTIQYMAPEQAAGLQVSPAADWYSVGVMLYQALTGQLPFGGTTDAILNAKQHQDPTPVHMLLPSVPYDLNQLCSDLLRRDPRARPTGAEILQRLHAKSEPTAVMAAALSGDLFVGRKEEVAALRQAFKDMRQGPGTGQPQGITLLLSGESGVGKSFLVHHVLRELGKGHRELVVLTGRCYERESVSYKALDALIDRLSLYLQHLPAKETQSLWPAHFGLLAKLFPVLEPLLQNSGGAAPQIPEPTEMRRCAFSALRELLTRLAQQVPLILMIDDLQWADADSFVLLGELLRPPSPPPLLLLGTVRTGTTEELSSGSPLLAQLPGEVRRLHLRKLPDADARAMVMQLLGPQDIDAASLATEIAREAQGHPLFIDELVRVRRQHPGPVDNTAAAAPLRLDDALWLRAQQMDGAARRLLEVVALAGVPIPQETALMAATAEPAQFDTLVAELRAARLVRTSGVRRSDTIEPYHDRVRESVHAHLTEQGQKIWHGRLALAMESLGVAAPETLVRHWQGAGHPERAASYAIKAAEQAKEALAFDRAARLYRQAMELAAVTGTQRRELLTQLAEALHNAGRGREAAHIFMEAAEGAIPQQASMLRRRAADQLLRSGHYSEGLALVRQALHDLGLRVPNSMPEIIGSLVLHRTWLSLRGFGFRQRAESEIESDELARIDALLACANTFGVVDPQRGIEFSTRHVLRALRAGEPSRVAFSMLATANGMAVFGGQSTWARAQRLMDSARALAQKTDNPHLHGYLLNIDGIMHWTNGHFRKSLALMDQAEKFYRERCTGVGWDLATLRILGVDTAYCLGDLRRMARELEQAMVDANRRGDLYLHTCLGTNSVPLLDLVRDDPERCRQDVIAHLRSWSYPGFSHYLILGLYRTVESYLYEGQGSIAYCHLDEEMPAQGKLLLRLVQNLRIHHADLRGRCAIAAASEDWSRREHLLQQGERHARALAHEESKWAEALAAVLRAGIASVREGAKGKEALRALVQAETLLGNADLLLHVNAVRYRRGQLLDGEPGRELLSASDHWMREQGILNPARFASMLVPGFSN